jgi:FAD/FMN-containing dehydrogenase
MVMKVDRPQSADSSGVYRRPRVVVKLKAPEDISNVLVKIRNYPSPVRALGADYSQTRCVGGDGGTTVDTGNLSRILEIEDGYVRAQAGVRVGTLVRVLAERGLELPLTPESGNISVGTLAVATLPQASYHDGFAQMSSCVVEMKVTTPQGKVIVVNERQRDLMRVLRSSFGLLGIVSEVMLRVRPMKAVKIDYRRYSLADFIHRYTKIMGDSCALRLHLAPFNDRVTVERRSLDEESNTSRSGIWQIRNSVMRNVLPAFGSTVGSVLAAPGLRNAVLTGVHQALNATQSPGERGVVMFAHEWLRELPPESWKARHTYSLWAFPAETFPKLLTDYFAFCRSYYKEHRYRCNVVTVASRLHKDRSSLFSVSYGGPVMTLEPSSNGDAGWEDFLIDFNDFASAHHGIPTFNQSRGLQPEHVTRAFGDRVRLFRALRERADPLNRLSNSYFAYLLG